MKFINNYLKNILIILIIIFLNINLVHPQKRLISYVDPFIGTDAHGHTFPGATLPFGMVQLSPDTRRDGWDWCSGYHSSDSTILGFSHTHLSGTGASDYGDILFMPINSKPTIDDKSKSISPESYRCLINRDKEIASAGYYSVFIESSKIKVDLTVTKRTGFHSYYFTEPKETGLIIDLTHGIHDRNKENYFKKLNDFEIEGYRKSNGWSKEHTVYFVAKFNQPISQYIICDGKTNSKQNNSSDENLVIYLKFNLKDNQLLSKVGISHTSIDGARKNLNKENPNWDFEKVKKAAEESWEKQLEKILVESTNEQDKQIFYTAMYHSMISPNVFSDVDGNYIGMDRKLRKAKGFEMYTVFSLWDTFRALHPLLTLIDKKYTRDFVKSLIQKAKELGVYPMWELASNDTYCMIGYHSVPVILDAFRKGIRDFNKKDAFDYMLKTSTQFKHGINFYMNYGYIPMDKDVDASSKTLEYAYNDWCIAEFAKDLNFKIDYKYYLERAKNYINVFDSSQGFMNGRYSNGLFKKNFDPKEPYPLGVAEFTEGNAWQYTWFVPQDIPNLIKLIGGNKKFENKLDKLFNPENVGKYNDPADMTGLIGQYAHGNEPSHHISYLYNYCGAPYKTQEKVRNILTNQYKTGRSGLSGNDDCGQMSAWYILSSIGIYPVTPGDNLYAFSSPIFDNIKINLENGKVFEIRTMNNSPKNIYIKNIKLNNRNYKSYFLDYNKINNGGKILFEMSQEPNINQENDFNLKLIPNCNNSNFIQAENKILFPPYIENTQQCFLGSKEIDLKTISNDAKIFYTLDGSTPDEKSFEYTTKFSLDSSFHLRALCKRKNEKSEILDIKFYKSLVKENGSDYPKIDLKYPPHRLYKGNNDFALIDGNLSTKSYLDKNWSGWQKDDLNAIIDFGKEIELKGITIRFLQNQGSWIFLPKKIIYEHSKDGTKYDFLGDMSNKLEKNYEVQIVDYKNGFNNIKTRYLKVIAENIGFCPEWHSGAGNESFIFCDEVIVEAD